MLPKSQLRMLFLGGILPVVAFTLIEEYYGTAAGLVAGMVLGVAEITWEWRTQRRVDPVTWSGNGALLVLGAISLLTEKGIWFKLQPALLEAVTGAALVGSVIVGKPILLAMVEKQGIFERFPGPVRPQARALLAREFSRMCVRLGLFFFAHAVLAIWAALYASTAVWAFLKGVGFTVSMVLYLAIEGVALRRKVKRLAADRFSS